MSRNLGRWFRQRRGRRASPALATFVISIALVGCGSTHHRTATTPTPQGTATTSTSEAAGAPGGTPQSGGPQSATAFATEVNVVCTSVRHGAPPYVLGHPFTGAALVRYDSRVKAPAQRTVISLTRLDTQARLQRVKNAARLTQLTTAWRQLQKLYDAIPAASHKPKTATAVGLEIVKHERKVSSLAHSLDFPACAVTSGVR